MKKQTQFPTPIANTRLAKQTQFQSPSLLSKAKSRFIGVMHSDMKDLKKQTQFAPLCHCDERTEEAISTLMIPESKMRKTNPISMTANRRCFNTIAVFCV
jgi:hypothetical protein